MFRLKFDKKHEKLIEEITEKPIEYINSKFYGQLALIEDDSLKIEFEKTGLCGQGIAILGMKDFAPDSKTLTIEFDSIEDADNFKTWLCNRGEQYFWEDDFENGSFVDFDYHDPGGSTIIAKRIKRD